MDESTGGAGSTAGNRATSTATSTPASAADAAVEPAQWRHGCRVDEMAEGAAMFKAAGRRIVVITIDGRLFAFDDFCPHSGGPMHRGELEGCVLTCPLHGWRFDLERQGEELHGLRPLPMYPARIADGNLEVFL